MDNLAETINPDIIRTLCVLNCTLFTYLMYKQYNNIGRRRFWVKDIFKRRCAQGFQANLINEMRFNDPESHFRFFRMNKCEFDELLGLVRPLIFKPDSRFRKSIAPEEKLSLTLRYLASGDVQVSLSFAYRLGKSTVSKIINETCKAIWIALSPIYLKKPNTSAEWRSVSDAFERNWQLPHCIGALDGKHVNIQCPPNSGSQFYNYKGTFSIVLMAMCDSDYRFLMVDIGAYGSQSDGGVFSNSSFGKNLKAGQASLPAPSLLPNSNQIFPYFIASDEAFPLSPNIMRPYSRRGLTFLQRIFNYRLCRARRVIENAFGILVARWRIFHTTIQGKPENIDGIIKATVCVHNYIISKDLLKKKEEVKYIRNSNFLDREAQDGTIKPGEWRTEAGPDSAIVDCGNLFHANRHSINVGNLRDTLAHYLGNEGSVPWQIERINRG